MVPTLQLDDVEHQPETSPCKNESTEDRSKVTLAPLRSGACTWAEEVELQWSTTVTRDNLLALRDFFKQGMKITVLEQVVHSTFSYTRVLSFKKLNEHL